MLWRFDFHKLEPKEFRSANALIGPEEYVVEVKIVQESIEYIKYRASKCRRGE